MTAGIYESSSAHTEADDRVAALVDVVVDQVCRDLRGWVPRNRVRQLATELMTGYRDAVVTAYIPIILRRQLREQLKAESAREQCR